MDLIHATDGFVELQQLTTFDVFDCTVGVGSELTDNDFELTMLDSDWQQLPIEQGHYLYVPGTEFGGRVERVEHINDKIRCGGLTWRGMLSRKVISPPSNSAYKIINNKEANSAIAELVNSQFGALVAISAESTDINVSGQYRYANMLNAIQSMLTQFGLRLVVNFNMSTVILSAAKIKNYSDEEEFSQDYISRSFKSAISEVESYNHIIALGRGELANRQVVELWRDDNGQILTEPFTTGIEDKQIVLDYPNVESLDELRTAAIKKLIEYIPKKEIEINIEDTEKDLNIGDVVGGVDFVTGLKIEKTITNKLLRIDSDGVTITYRTGA